MEQESKLFYNEVRVSVRPASGGTCADPVHGWRKPCVGGRGRPGHHTRGATRTSLEEWTRPSWLLGGLSSNGYLLVAVRII